MIWSSRNLLVCLGNNRYGLNTEFETEGMVEEEAGGKGHDKEAMNGIV